MFNCSAVNTSNESLESVTRQAEEADAQVTRSNDLMEVFGSTLLMVNFVYRLLDFSKLFCNQLIFRCATPSKHECQMYTN